MAAWTTDTIYSHSSRSNAVLNLPSCHRLILSAASIASLLGVSIKLSGGEHLRFTAVSFPLGLSSNPGHARTGSRYRMDDPLAALNPLRVPAPFSFSVLS